MQAVSEKGTKFTSVATNFYQSNDFYQNQKWLEVSRNVVEGVVHREGAELPAVFQQVEEEDFGAQVEEPQEAGLEAGGPVVDLEVVAVVVVEVVEVEVDLAVVEVVEVGVSEGRSSAASKNLSPYCKSFALYFFFQSHQIWRSTKNNLTFLQ